MQLYNNVLVIVTISIVINSSHEIDPISIATGAGIGWLAAGSGIDFVKRHTYCNLKECCNDDYVTGNITKLHSELTSHLFGQHIVIQMVVPAISAHFSEDTSSKKSLVLSFHGTSGTGKNYVADFIAKSLYKNGLNSKFVHLFKGRADFPLKSESTKYSQQIKEIVEQSTKDCPRSLFIFDEVEKMPNGIFESLTSLVDYGSNPKTGDYKKAIFVFLSNTAGEEINSLLGELLSRGTKREETTESDFENLLETAAYNLEGGLQRSSLIETHLVDHYVPFLPLEREHLVKCLEAEFRRWKREPDSKVIENIINKSLSFDETMRFATSGCKRIDKKVALEIRLRS